MMIAIKIYDSIQGVSNLARDDETRLLNKGYSIGYISSYFMLYRNWVVRDRGEYYEVLYPTHIVIYLEKVVLVIYSLYDYNNTISWIYSMISS